MPDPTPRPVLAGAFAAAGICAVLWLCCCPLVAGADVRADSHADTGTDAQAHARVDARADARAGGRPSVWEDFEAGSVTLTSYPDEDFDPDDWELQSQETYGGSAHALRMWGNTWKELAITPRPLTAETLLQAAIYAEEVGELQAIAFGDSSEHELFYCVSGDQLVLSDRWNVVYQGAFPTEEWNIYELPLGQDWLDTWGYLPVINRIIFVNDHDGGPHGTTIFDEIYDISDAEPIAPTVAIEALAAPPRQLAREAAPGVPLYRLDVQFQSLVFDPDSDSLAYAWDFGDGATSSEPNPAHSFTATADYTFTVSLDVTDEDGLWGRDTCQVAVEPGGGVEEFTINFTGDIFTGRAYDEPGGLIDTYGVEYLFEPTLPILGDAADVTMVNAEVAYTDRGDPHPTKSVVFRTRPENIAGLVYAGVDVASTGNNHIIDYGREGLEQTHAVFDSAGITHAGSGVNDYFALQPCYYTHAGVRMAFYCACNRTGREYNYQPFLDAGHSKSGFGYWLEPNNERALAAADTLADIVFAVPHSGEEYETEPPAGPGGAGEGRVDIELCPPFVPYEEAPDVRFRIWPGPGDRQLRYRAIEMGADAVINHHPHVLQGFEVYQGKLIAHSLGNFMFDLYYPETMPTLVLTARVSKTGIDAWHFTPAFIDDYIPRPATGRLGTAILERMADYSRHLNTFIGIDREALEGRIFLSEGEFYPELTLHSGTRPVSGSGGRHLSQPIAIAADGSLARLLAVEGLAPGDAEIRVGREVLWFGRFEPDEGHSMWNLNSEDEWLDDAIFHEGAHALALRRASNAPDNVITTLERHLPASDTLAYSLTGWMRTVDANDAYFAMRFYSSRYTWNPIGTYLMGESVDGTSEWTYYAADFAAPNGTDYFNMRCNVDRPQSGEAQAWFDDLRVIEWEAWQPVALPLEIDYPNNYRFVQVRSTSPADSATVSYETARLLDAAFSGIGGEPERRAPARLVAHLGVHPNPVRAEAAIRYELASAARVSLEVFDVTGRLVSRLAQDQPQRAGWHSVAWQAGARPAGVYFARLTVAGTPHARKMVLMP